MNEIERTIAEVVTPKNLSTFLLATGWRVLSRSYAGTRSWTSADWNERPLLVPLEVESEDEREILLESVQRLATRWQISLQVAAQRLAAAVRDTLRFRAIGNDVEYGTIPLGDGIEFLQGVRNAVGAASKAGVERRSYYGTALWPTSKRAVEEIRLGQTEAGSYVVNVLADSAITLGDGSNIWVNSAPMQSRERQTLVTAVRAISAAQKMALTAEVSGLDGFWELVDDGVSSDLCSALASMTHAAGVEGMVEITVEASTILEWPYDAPREIRMPGRLHKTFVRASEALKATETTEKAVISGYVESLKRPRVDLEGAIVLKSYRTPGLKDGATVRADLIPGDYQVVLTQHGSGSLTTLHGTLVVEGTSRRLYKARLSANAETADGQQDFFLNPPATVD